ncbi:methyltransferase domain-containing protein [Prosthecochloris sp. N3]|uniref:Methyltransferase domain-containing protein n=1 Tax=Prosthecochloris ethylica TaxID=2743976 RepID=A0ABR9XQ08_9CHLB|nr:MULTISPECIES: class I SAM-dependent methyltransferase [Prosthecochloris]MEC9487427.1 class I SAM-dependent methyltransferase [Prosthecochloris sp.]MBF0586266.1 methyltransferase domain-containing protein [Prosthecochloris ethylica]MBF0635972.1 methyltransferase domain-containing protein [Prosthecochloris ethylica]NUK47353.1 methyltransferase domain-containing protein [Prosthecochloris ethylica]RNA65846.1 class I SAM-dependent methyltransferase [Prosthecochloris sp. ZM_2]
MPKTEPFDRYSAAYDSWFERHAEEFDAELKLIRQLMPPGHVEALEVGVGSGKFAGPLAISTGVEPSAPMAARAAGLGIDVHDGVAEQLPFSDERFDLVLMVTAICFVDDTRQALSEAWRVLKPEGCLIVGFVDRESRLGKEYLARQQNSRFYREALFYSARDVLHLLQHAGFEVAAVRQTLIPGSSAETIRDGYGDGGFVGIKAKKSKKVEPE